MIVLQLLFVLKQITGYLSLMNTENNIGGDSKQKNYVPSSLNANQSIEHCTVYGYANHSQIKFIQPSKYFKIKQVMK